MEKINFENLPSTNTPLNADTLNGMQNKIEKSANYIGSTQPSTGESVWIKKGKNLFDNTFIQMRDDAPSTIRIEGKKIPLENVFDTPQAVSLSNNLNLSTYKWSVNIKTNTGGNYDYDSGWIENANSWTVSQSRISELMTRGNAQIYFVIAKKDGTNIYVSEMNNYNFQIEVGATATTFEPYIEKEIQVKNDNGIFEKFYSEYYDNYSTAEQKIGTWIDGKPLYRKTIKIQNTALANGNNIIAHNINNLKQCIKAELAKEGSHIFPYFNYANNTLTMTGITNVDSTDMQIRCVNDSWGNTNIWYATLYYTKTTD